MKAKGLGEFECQMTEICHEDLTVVKWKIKTKRLEMKQLHAVFVLRACKAKRLEWIKVIDAKYQKFMLENEKGNKN